MAPAAALPDELTEEIFLRIHPADASTLVRAALACKRWCRLIADPGFRRRFREFHRAPPVLGFLRNTSSDCIIGGDRYGFAGDRSSVVARFVPTSSCLAGVSWRDWRVLDACHGRALLYKRLASRISDDRLVVWDPVRSEMRELPAIPESPFDNEGPFISWNAAVLCVAAGCNHLDCHRKPFAVVFVAFSKGVMFNFVYWSEAGRWSELTDHFAPQPNDRLKLEPSALVGNAFYFMLQSRTKILKYNISTREMGVIQLPTVCSWEQHVVLMATEDVAGLGFAIVRDWKLCLWSMEVGSDRDAGWAQRAVIDLKKLRPNGALSAPSPHVVGFADGIGIIFVQTNDGVVTIDLKSTRVTRVPKISGGSSIFPYMSFCFPALRAPAASTGGPGTGASKCIKSLKC